MMVPTIHLNGTSREDLEAAAEAAYRALTEAIEKVAALGPNGRDFYPQGPDALGQALEEHAQLRGRLEAVRGEVEIYYNALVDKEV